MTGIDASIAPREANVPAPLHAWNPGLEPGLPRAVGPLATIFRSENIEQSFREIEELADFSGLAPAQLALFRPERLVVHEVLIRVMADLSVPIGAVYADLGVNFRRMVSTILCEGINAHQTQLAETLRRIRADADSLLDIELAALLDEPVNFVPTPPKRSFWPPSWFGSPRSDATRLTRADREACELRQLETAQYATDTLHPAVRGALRQAVTAVIGRHGMLVRDRRLLRQLAGILVSNAYGSRRIGAAIEPLMDVVVQREGYRRLRAQDQPIVMSVKGSSASGKSTIRPYQRALAERIGADWSDFAVITPDVWRKFLLDYESLGDARRYAGPLTAHEVEIVDAKLDLYVTRKEWAGRISHLLIDRFRFDSFTTDTRLDGSGQLLTRFGHRIFLQFMVTPPEATVERAWKRGQQFGRFKAVEDLLAHNVEAYGGMPRLFFLWALRRDKQVCYEFLDNRGPEGRPPITIAFGTNAEMTILDPQALIDIERFRKVHIHASRPDDVYARIDLAPERNAGFLQECLRQLDIVRFADPKTGRVYARFNGGTPSAIDRTLLARAAEAPGMSAALAAAGLPGDRVVPGIDETIDFDVAATLGSRGRLDDPR